MLPPEKPPRKLATTGWVNQIIQAVRDDQMTPRSGPQHNVQAGVQVRMKVKTAANGDGVAVCQYYDGVDVYDEDIPVLVTTATDVDDELFALVCSPDAGVEFSSNPVYWKEAGGGVVAAGSGTVLVYIFGNRTMGGAYKGYIIRDAAFNDTIDSSGAIFTPDDISADIADIDDTDAQEVTVLNMDETGLTTHALTAATQIKYIVLARTTTITDDDNGDCMVVICGDSDNEACPEA